MPEEVVCMAEVSLPCEHRGVIRYQDNDAKTTGWEEQVNPGLNLSDLDVEPGRNDASFIETAVQLNDNLAGTVVVNDFEFTDVTCESRISEYWYSNR